MTDGERRTRADLPVRRAGAKVSWPQDDARCHGEWTGARWVKDTSRLVVRTDAGSIERVPESAIRWEEE